MSSVSRYPVRPTPRCRFCGGVLMVFKGKPYCPECTSFTLPDGTPDDDYYDDPDDDDKPINVYCPEA
jgi:hypothetical protein